MLSKIMYLVHDFTSYYSLHDPNTLVHAEYVHQMLKLKLFIGVYISI